MKKTVSGTRGNVGCRYYLLELRESNGNTCIVYDVTVEAKDREEAKKKVSSYFDELAKGEPDGGWESDGGWGYYFPCDCEESECCCDHGGITMEEPDEWREFSTVEEVTNARALFHSHLEV